jgi:proline iminopeptidase
MPEARAASVSRVACGSARLYVREVGAGAPIVVVHGGPDFGHDYLLPELDRLADACRVVYYDQRGRGRSYALDAPDDVTMAGEVDDLDCVRRSVGLETMAVLGHSWGCLVAMEYALRFPERVSHLIMLGAAPASGDAARTLGRSLRTARTPEQSATMASLEADPAYRAGDLDPDAAWYRIHFQPALQRQELLDDLVGRLRRGSSAEGIVAARAIEQRLYDETWRAEDYDVLARLQRLSVPTLLLHGDADFIPVELARQLAEAIPGSRLEVLPIAVTSRSSTSRT